MCPCVQPPGKQRVRKNIFNRLSQAMDEMRKEGHKVQPCVHLNKRIFTVSTRVRRPEMSSCLCPQDVDDFFQNERDQNLILTGSTKTAAEVNQSSVTPAHLVPS